MLDPRILDSLPPEPKIVEVGVGGRFDLLTALSDRLPGAVLIAVDVDPEKLHGAPADVITLVQDVHEASHAVYRGVDLFLARRAPVELQPALARLARDHGSMLALQGFKDEWASLETILGGFERVGGQDTWRWWPRSPPR